MSKQFLLGLFTLVATIFIAATSFAENSTAAAVTGPAWCCSCVCKAKNGDSTTLNLCTVNEQGGCKWRVGKFCKWGFSILYREGTIKSCGDEYEVVLTADKNSESEAPTQQSPSTEPNF